MTFAIRSSASGEVVGSAYNVEFAQQLSSELASVVGTPVFVDQARNQRVRLTSTDRLPQGMRHSIRTR